MFATARRISALEALEAGLVNIVDEDAMGRALAIASRQG
jgi:enoyl-CoA hydratase/carnithine racemase